MKKALLVFVFALTSLNAFADLNRFPRSKVVTGDRAQEIYGELTEGERTNDVAFWLSNGEVRAGTKPAPEVKVANCEGAIRREGYFKPAFLSAFDHATCLKEKGQTICFLATSGHEIFDSKKKAENSWKKVSETCGKAMSETECVLTEGQTFDDLCG